MFIPCIVVPWSGSSSIIIFYLSYPTLTIPPPLPLYVLVHDARLFGSNIRCL